MPERAVRALSAIASAPPGAVLFHCVSGRDRTGLVRRDDPSIEAAIRAALEGLDLARVLAQGEMSDGDRAALSTWRSTTR